MSARPLALGHVGLCVANLDAAIAWYCEVLGCELLDGPWDIDVEDPRLTAKLRDVFGAELRRARIAQLGLDGGVGLELFEFVEPATHRPVPASYFHAGFSHVCFTAPDLEAMVERIRAAGGRIRTEVWPAHPRHPHRFVHFEDPFGNLLELHSHSNEEMVAIAVANA
jgi:catechol 2,3-dioxygenase-like lactoylglutathione lyase family enzyme